jgi:hypothetical protein
MDGKNFLPAAIAFLLFFGCLGMNAQPGVSVAEDDYQYGSFLVHALICGPSSGNATNGIVLTGGDGVTLEKLRPACESFASKGFVALAHENVNGTAMDNIQIVETGILHLRLERPNLKSVALWAHSSGTIYSVFAAYDQRNISAFIETSGHFQVPLCDSRNGTEENCAAYLDEFPAPIMVVHGDNDSVVAPSFAYAFEKRLAALNMAHSMLIVPGAAHEFMLDKPGVLDAEAEFIRNATSAK